MILDCPLPDELTAIPQPTCPFKLDQIVRAAFQRRQPSDDPAFPTLADFQDLAEWTAFKAATDDTKIVVSPIFSGLVIPQSEALTTGGNDNSTFNGIREYNGEGSVTIAGQFKNLPPASKRAMELLSQESLAGATGISNLCICMFNREGYSFPENPVTALGVATTIYKFIPIYNFRISTLGSEGFNAPNINGFSFDVAEGWDRYLVSVKPAFDALTEI